MKEWKLAYDDWVDQLEIDIVCPEWFNRNLTY